MPRIDNEKFYKSAIEMFGTTAKGVNWHSKEYQKIRFDMILALLPKNGPGNLRKWRKKTNYQKYILV